MYRDYEAAFELVKFLYQPIRQIISSFKPHIYLFGCVIKIYQTEWSRGGTESTSMC